MTRHKAMPREERAKQFVPFAALKGYAEALEKKEEEVRRSYEADGEAQDGPAQAKTHVNSRQE